MRRLDKEILSLAGPSILANITVPLVGMVDIAVVGHLGAAAVRGGGNALTTAALIGGISIGSMLFDLLYWGFGFLRTGTGGLAAQAFGRREKAGSGPDADLARRDEADVLARAVGIAMLSGLALIAVQWLFLRFAFLFIGCSPEVEALAMRYFRIRIWAAPATLSLFAFKGWFIGMQDTVSAMRADLLVNGLNMAASAALAFGTPLGYDGVAAGTVIAQWSGLLFAAGVVATKYRGAVFAGYTLQDARRALRTDARAFFSMNMDLILRSVGMIAVYIGFTVLSARFGDALLSASAIIMKLMMVFSYFTDGFAYAGEALTGRAIGLQDSPMLRQTVRSTFAWSMGVVGLFLVLYGAFGLPMVRLMTSDPAVVDTCRPFLPWLLLMPLVGCPAFTWDGIFTGAAATRPMRDGTLLSAVGFFGIWLLGRSLAGAFGGLGGDRPVQLLMAAYFAHLLIRSVWLHAAYRKQVPGRIAGN